MWKNSKNLNKIWFKDLNTNNIKHESASNIKRTEKNYKSD